MPTHSGGPRFHELMTAARNGSMGRRELLGRSTVLGLSLGSIGSLLAACGSSDDDAGGGTQGTTAGGATAATTAPTGETTASGAPTTGGTLRIGSTMPGRELDPLTGWGAGFATIQACHNYLVRIDNDFALAPEIATEWTPSEGSKVWTFKIREGVKFHDGAELTPETVRLTYERMVDPDGGSAALSAFAGVLSPGGATVDGDSVVFTLDRPFSDFPYLCSNSNYTSMILADDYAGDWAAQPNGTGPFKLESIDMATGGAVVRNDDYWVEGEPYLDRVEYMFYADEQALVLAIQAGDVDSISPDVVQARALTSDPTIVIDQVASTNLTAFNMRVDTAPFDRKEVRQAVAYALDRAAIVERVLNGVGVEGNDHLVAPAFAAAPRDLVQRAKDLDKVAELLGGETVSFTLTYEAPGASYAQVVLAQLEEAGFDVTPEELPSDAFYGGDPETDTPWLFAQATLVGWAARPTPSQFLVPMVTSGGVWNSAKYENPELDDAVASYDTSETDEDKQQWARTIAEILLEDTPVVVTYWGGLTNAVREGFSGVTAGYYELSKVQAT